MNHIEQPVPPQLQCRHLNTMPMPQGGGFFRLNFKLCEPLCPLSPPCKEGLASQFCLSSQSWIQESNSERADRASKASFNCIWFSVQSINLTGKATIREIPKWEKKLKLFSKKQKTDHVPKISTSREKNILPIGKMHEGDPFVRLGSYQ